MKDGIEEFILVRFNRKSGKIDRTLEEIGCEQLKRWVLDNTPKTKDSIIFSKDTGKVVMYVEGSEKTPNVTTENLGYIDRYCEGLFEAVQDEET